MVLHIERCILTILTVIIIKITLSIGNSNNIAAVYNVGKIKTDKLSSAKLIAVVGSKTLDNLSVNNNISQNDNVVKNSVSENGKSIMVFLEKSTEVDGDKIHKATSIHTRENLFEYLKQLKDATVLVENENKLIAVSGSSIKLERFKQNNKFINTKISQNDQKSSFQLMMTLNRSKASL